MYSNVQYMQYTFLLIILKTIIVFHGLEFILSTVNLIKYSIIFKSLCTVLVYVHTWACVLLQPRLCLLLNSHGFLEPAWLASIACIVGLIQDCRERVQ